MVLWETKPNIFKDTADRWHATRLPRLVIIKNRCVTKVHKIPANVI